MAPSVQINLSLIVVLAIGPKLGYTQIDATPSIRNELSENSSSTIHTDSPAEIVDEILQPVRERIWHGVDPVGFTLSHPSYSETQAKFRPPELPPPYLLVRQQLENAKPLLPRLVGVAAAAFAAHDQSLRSYLVDIDFWYVPVADEFRSSEYRRGGAEFIEVLPDNRPFLRFRGRIGVEESGRWTIRGYESALEPGGLLHLSARTRGTDGWVRGFSPGASRGVIRPQDEALIDNPLPGESLGRGYLLSLTSKRLSEVVLDSSEHLQGWLDNDGMVVLHGPVLIENVLGHYGVRIVLDPKQDLVPRSISLYSGRFGMLMSHSVFDDYVSTNGVFVPTKIWQIGCAPRFEPHQLNAVAEAEQRNFAFPESERRRCGLGDAVWEDHLRTVFGPDGPNFCMGPFGWSRGFLQYQSVNTIIPDEEFIIEVPSGGLIVFQKWGGFLRSNGKSLVRFQP